MVLGCESVQGQTVLHDGRESERGQDGGIVAEDLPQVQQEAGLVLLLGELGLGA